MARFEEINGNPWVYFNFSGEPSTLTEVEENVLVIRDLEIAIDLMLRFGHHVTKIRINAHLLEGPQIGLLMWHVTQYCTNVTELILIDFEEGFYRYIQRPISSNLMGVGMHRCQFDGRTLLYLIDAAEKIVITN